MREGLEKRLWSVMERGLREFDQCPQPRPELWPLIRESLSLILEYPAERIIAGASKCSLDTQHLVAWIMAEARHLDLASESKLAELEACWQRKERGAWGGLWSVEDFTPHLQFACG